MRSILSIDGGGIRGIIPALLLAEIEKQTQRPVCELFDYIAGTSTGGIITSMLTVPGAKGRPKYAAKEVADHYIELGRSVFHRSNLRTALTLNGLSGTRYSAGALEKHLDQFLGGARLHSTLTNILVPAYEMVSGTPWFFKTTYARARRNTAEDPFLTQVSRATSAAPTYFPPFPMGSDRCFIDGGIFANNPALCAYAEARNAFPAERSFIIVSLGTGQNQVSHRCSQIKNWGKLQWTIPLLGILPNAANGTVDYQMNTLAGKTNYHRFQVRLSGDMTEMNNASDENIKRLMSTARAEISRNEKKIARICRLLGENADKKHPK